MGFQLMVLAEAAAGFSTADRADSHLRLFRLSRYLCRSLS